MAESSRKTNPSMRGRRQGAWGEKESGRRSGDAECEERDVTPRAPMALGANTLPDRPKVGGPSSAFVTLKAA